VNEIRVNEQGPNVTASGDSNSKTDLRPPYEPPRLTVMNEDEVLSAFQVPVVAGSWWG
jgi:hypothetical protein